MFWWPGRTPGLYNNHNLNNNDIDDKIFDIVYSQLREIKNESKLIKINLLIGGAGTAFNDLFSNYGVEMY